MFLRNLNVFIPYLYLLSATLGAMLSTTFDTSFAEYFPQSANPYLVRHAPSLLLIVLALCIVWWRTGLSPSSYRPEREKRFKRGHNLVAMGNISFAITLLGAFKLPFLLFLLTPFVLLAYISWIVGLIMIWSSRANA